MELVFEKLGMKWIRKDLEFNWERNWRTGSFIIFTNKTGHELKMI